MKIQRFSIISMALAVTLGAVGAHLLKGHLETKYLETFETGVRYQIYHSLALLWLSDKFKSHNRILTPYLFIGGIFFFSLNCILYALTQQKIFVILVPIGGFCFIIGWLCLFFEIKKIYNNLNIK